MLDLAPLGHTADWATIEINLDTNGPVARRRRALQFPLWVLPACRRADRPVKPEHSQLCSPSSFSPALAVAVSPFTPTDRNMASSTVPQSKASGQIVGGRPAGALRDQPA